MIISIRVARKQTSSLCLQAKAKLAPSVSSVAVTVLHSVQAEWKQKLLSFGFEQMLIAI